MMEAKPITVPRSAIALKTRYGPLDTLSLPGGGRGLYINSQTFVAACGCSPTAAAITTDSRYRINLTVDGWDELNGIYYVGGWSDEGLCGVERDNERTRREAIVEQKARKTS